MVSEAKGRAVEFLVLAFAIGLGLWLLCQLRFTRNPDVTWDDGWPPGDGPHHHDGSAERSSGRPRGS